MISQSTGLIAATPIRVLTIAMICFIAPAIRAQQPAAENKTEGSSGVITGRITTSAGEPLTNAFVAVFRMGSNGNPQNVRVDSTGAFKSEALDPGLYRVSAYVPGFIYETSQNNPSYYHPGDAVNLTMIKGGVINGTITNSNNAPVVATSVRAFRVRDQNGKAIPFPVAVRERLTDDRGIYRLYALTPGTYVISAGGPARFFGGAPPTAYETDVPTYAPSSTRDTAAEVTVNSGDEITADIQYRGDPGHAISGAIAGGASFQGQVSLAAGIWVIDLNTHAQLTSTSTNSFSNFAFSVFGVPDGEYEVYAYQSGLNRETLMSPPKHIKVQGADVTGINLTVAPLGSIEGRLVLENDPKNACAKRRSSAAQETIIFARRRQPEAGASTTAQTKSNQIIDVPLVYQNSVSETIIDPKGGFNFRSLQPGTYRIDPREPAAGWYVRSIAVEPGNKNANIARDGVALKSGERAAGLVVTMTEGAAGLRGRISLAEGQSLSPAVRVYMVPAERESAENVLRFYESRPEGNGSFLTDNVAPGKYWIVARPMEENDSGIAKSIRQDATFRLKVFKEGEALKKEIAFKPCEQTKDYDLPYSSASPNP